MKSHIPTPEQAMTILADFGTPERMRAFLNFMLASRSLMDKRSELEERYQELAFDVERFEPFLLNVLAGAYDAYWPQRKLRLERYRLALLGQTLWLYQELSWEQLARRLDCKTQACAVSFRSLIYPRRHGLALPESWLKMFLDAAGCSPALQVRALECFAACRAPADISPKPAKARKPAKQRARPKPQRSPAPAPPADRLSAAALANRSPKNGSAESEPHPAYAWLPPDCQIDQGAFLAQVADFFAKFAQPPLSTQTTSRRLFKISLAALYKRLLRAAGPKQAAGVLAFWLAHFRRQPAFQDLAANLRFPDRIFETGDFTTPQLDQIWRDSIRELADGRRPDIRTILMYPALAESLLCLLYPYTVRSKQEKEKIKKFPELYLTLWPRVPRNDLTRCNRIFENFMLQLSWELSEQQILNLLESRRWFRDYLLERIQTLEDWRPVFVHYGAPELNLKQLADAWPALFELIRAWVVSRPAWSYQDVLARIPARQNRFEAFFERFYQLYQPESWITIFDARKSGKVFCGKTAAEIAAYLDLTDLPPGYRGHISLGRALWPENLYLQKLDAALSDKQLALDACRQLLRAYARSEKGFRQEKDKQAFRFWGLTVTQFWQVFGLPPASENSAYRLDRHDLAFKAIAELVRADGPALLPRVATTAPPNPGTPAAPNSALSARRRGARRQLAEQPDPPRSGGRQNP